MNVKFKHNNKDYVIDFKTINVLEACKIDYNSYIENKTSEILEWKHLLNNVYFKLYFNGEIVFDSEFNNPNKIEFTLLRKILNIIQEELEISNSELTYFVNDCTMFLKKETTKMPPELIIAQNIKNNRIQLSLTDIQNMSVKNYEKINLALELLNSL
jgi:hypothetical protein